LLTFTTDSGNQGSSWRSYKRRGFELHSLPGLHEIFMKAECMIGSNVDFELVLLHLVSWCHPLIGHPDAGEAANLL